MYFAVNKPAANLLSQALTCVQGNPTGGRWFALLDKAFDHDIRTPLRWPHQSEAIYKGAGDIEAVSPTLLALSTHATEAAAQEMAHLLRHCQGRPMLSFVQTTLDMSDLAAAWHDVKWVRTDDGLRFLLRLADTRVLSSLADALQPHNWKRICKPLQAWQIVDRTGGLQPLTLPMGAPNGAEEPKHDEPVEAFQINDKELALLLDAAQPDVLINTLFEQVPDVLPTDADQAKVHAWVRQACDLATVYGLDATGDQLALAATACLTEGSVLADPRLPGLLARHQPGQASLVDALAELLPVDEVPAT